jgi:hypothetical protein
LKKPIFLKNKDFYKRTLMDNFFEEKGYTTYLRTSGILNNSKITKILENRIDVDP